MNDELDIILNIFKENKLNLECIDTISTFYNRLLKNVIINNQTNYDICLALIEELSGLINYKIIGV